VAVLRLLAAFDLRPASNTLGSMKSRSRLAVDTRQSHLANPRSIRLICPTGLEPPETEPCTASSRRRPG
jgi:hypothetical protein